MNFDYGIAKNLYQRRIHPRVMFGPDDVATLRRRIRTGDGKRIMDAIRRKIRPDIKLLLRNRVGQTHFHDPKALTPTTVIWNLFDISMVGLLDDDDDACRAAGQALASLPLAYPKPNPSNSYTMMYGCSALAYDVLYDRLAEADRSAYAKWVVEGCLRPSLEAARPHFLRVCGANTPICYTIPAMLGLLCITGDPGVPDLRAETEEMIGYLRASLHGFLGPDGYPQEDIGYGTAVVGGISHVVEAARRAGLYDAYSDCDRYTKLGQAILQFVQPGGAYLTNNGDHTDCFLCRELPLARLARLTKSPELLWLLGSLIYPTGKNKQPMEPGFAFAEVPLTKRGFQTPSTTMSLLVMEEYKHAVHPKQAGVPTRFVARERGLVSLRDSWDDDATYVNFDGSQRSPAAQGHFHASAGHFSLSALGEYFAIWPSRYNMEQNCHNLTLIDGKSGRSTKGNWEYMQHCGVLTEFTPGDFVDLASVDSAHQHDCIWARRSLGFVRSGSSDGDAPSYVWTVDDINKANDWAEFWWQLHTSPENKIALRKQNATITGWLHGHHLDVHFAIPGAENFTKPHTLALDQDIAKPSSTAYLGADLSGRVKLLARPAKAVHGPVYYRPRLLGKVGGYNGRFMSIMLPRRKGHEPARFERIDSLANTLAVKITFGKVEDTLVWAFEHGMLEAGELSGRGRWCVVRRSRRNGRVLRTAGGGLTSLSVAGRKIRITPS